VFVGEFLNPRIPERNCQPRHLRLER
jgi:hypothetical protein